MSPYKNPEDLKKYNNSQARKDYLRQYRIDNKEKIAEYKKEYNKEYNLNNKEKITELSRINYLKRKADPELLKRDLAKTKKYYWDNRNYVIDYLGGKCTACGTTEDLEFDHIDPTTKEFEMSKPLSRKNLPEGYMTELDKCQLLCKACHKKKTFGPDLPMINDKYRKTKQANNEL